MQARQEDEEEGGSMEFDADAESLRSVHKQATSRVTGVLGYGQGRENGL